MGITERREREREGIRRKILDAARELFAREGYERVTMRAIAEAIEYSPTTIYNHFEDKDDLVEALCYEDFGRLFERLKGAALPSEPVERIRQLGRAYAAFALDYPNHYRFMFMTPQKVDLEKSAEKPGHKAFGLLREAVVEAIAAGRFRKGEPDTIAQVLWAGIHGAASLLITLQPQHWPTPAAPDLAAQVCDSAVRGFMAEA